VPSAAILTICTYISRDLDRKIMPYYDIPNIVTVAMINMMDEMPSGYGTLRSNAVRECGTKFGTELCRGLSCSGSRLQTCAAVSAAPTFEYAISQIS